MVNFRTCTGKEVINITKKNVTVAQFIVVQISRLFQNQYMNLLYVERF